MLLVPQLHHYSLTPLLCASTSLISTSFYNWCYCVSFTTTVVPSSSRNLVCLHLTHSTNCLSPLNWQHRFVMPCHFTCFCYFLPWASDVTTPMALHMLVPQLHHFLPFYPYTTFVRHLLRSFLHPFTIGAVVLASPPHPRPLQLGA